MQVNWKSEVQKDCHRSVKVKSFSKNDPSKLKALQKFQLSSYPLQRQREQMSKIWLSAYASTSMFLWLKLMFESSWNFPCRSTTQHFSWFPWLQMDVGEFYWMYDWKWNWKMHTIAWYCSESRQEVPLLIFKDPHYGEWLSVRMFNFEKSISATYVVWYFGNEGCRRFHDVTKCSSRVQVFNQKTSSSLLRWYKGLKNVKILLEQNGIQEQKPWEQAQEDGFKGSMIKGNPIQIKNLIWQSAGPLTARSELSKELRVILRIHIVRFQIFSSFLFSAKCGLRFWIKYLPTYRLDPMDDDTKGCQSRWG